MELLGNLCEQVHNRNLQTSNVPLENQAQGTSLITSVGLFCAFPAETVYLSNTTTMELRHLDVD